MDVKKFKNVAIIVAHPDDETLWCGGTILDHPDWKCFIVSLCRGSDQDRAPKFFKVMKILGAEGVMGDMDDGPDQLPVAMEEVENTILQLLPAIHFDLIITHDPSGEYTRHLRHEEISEAVIMIWNQGKISADEFWTFAYDDGNKKYFPQPVHSAEICNLLPENVWERKYKLMTDVYGYSKNSWEAKTTPKTEAFHLFKTPVDALSRLTKKHLVERSGIT